VGGGRGSFTTRNDGTGEKGEKGKKACGSSQTENGGRTGKNEIGGKLAALTEGGGKKLGSKIGGCGIKRSIPTRMSVEEGEGDGKRGIQNSHLPST